MACDETESARRLSMILEGDDGGLVACDEIAFAGLQLPMTCFVKLLITCVLENFAGIGGGVEGGRAFVEELEDVGNHGGKRGTKGTKGTKGTIILGKSGCGGLRKRKAVLF